MNIHEFIIDGVLTHTIVITFFKTPMSSTDEINYVVYYDNAIHTIKYNYNTRTATHIILNYNVSVPMYDNALNKYNNEKN